MRSPLSPLSPVIEGTAAHVYGLPEVEADITSPVQSLHGTSPSSPTSRRFTSMTTCTDGGDWSIVKRETKIVELCSAVPTLHVIPGFATTKSEDSFEFLETKCENDFGEKDIEMGIVQTEVVTTQSHYSRRQIVTAAILLILVPVILAAVITLTVLLLVH